MGMSKHPSFTRREGGFTTPAAAIALLVVCALVFTCARGISVGAQSGQIQYVADAGALAADSVVAEFVTVAQVVDATALSLSLLGLTVYAVSAVAAFIPGGQGAAAEIANMGSKVLQARDKFAESAARGLDAAQKALPAVCAVRAAQVVQANADASGIPYAGIAITSPPQGIDVSIPDNEKVKEAAAEIESKESAIQEASLRQKEAQEREDAAKERAWRADCGNSGMSMYERAGKLSNISGARNPYISSPDRWTFSVGLERAKAYYVARYAAEPGQAASGSPEAIAESVARKQFYAYAQYEVGRGYIEVGENGAETPHLVQLARNTEQIRGTVLYTSAIYPVSVNGDKRYLHGYARCPTCAEGTRSGQAAVSAIDAGTVERCPTCKFSATTLGRVPSASTSISNGFEYHYREFAEASRDYAQALSDGAEAKQALDEAKESIGERLSEALDSLAAKRYDPQPPGRYGCICVVLAPSVQASAIPFVSDEPELPARIAISGATLAPDAASDQGSVISGVAEGLIPQESLASGPAKLIFGAWSSMLLAYSNTTEGIKGGFRKVLGAIPLIGTTLSDSAVSAFENALSSASLEPADLDTYKPVLVNTARILERDSSSAAQVLARMKNMAQIYGAVSTGDMNALVNDIKAVPEVAGLLDEYGLELAEIPLADIGLGTSDGKLYLPVPNDIDARVREAIGSFLGTLGG